MKLKYRTVVLEVLSRLPRRDRVSHSGVEDSADHAVVELSRPVREEAAVSNSETRSRSARRRPEKPSSGDNALHAQHAEGRRGVVLETTRPRAARETRCWTSVR